MSLPVNFFDVELRWLKWMVEPAFLVSRIVRRSFLGVLWVGCLTLQSAGSEAQTIIDMHVHTAGIGAGESGCFVSSSLQNSYKFDFYLRAFGVSESELRSKGDRIVLQRISENVAASKSVQRAVVLAMDGVIDESGAVDKSRTQIYVPNEFVNRETKRYPNLLFGASINPYRKDALARLRAAHADGAVLVKWIPAIMDIDPGDPDITSFYETLVELNLPLLVHVGQERSFGEAKDEFGDPVRLELPLGIGVTVIAAHIASTGKNNGEPNFERLLPLFKRFDNLYTDISSLTQINKLGYLSQALKIPGLSDRMIYGSDWPLQFFPLVSPWFQLGRASPRVLWAVSKHKNRWDRDVALKRALGVPDAVFMRTGELLNIQSSDARPN
jgi:hypothetical protein